MADRTTVIVPTPSGGWLPPWPNVAEIADKLPHEHWSLVGGLMTQLHAIHHGIDVFRQTSDVDIIVHIETAAGRPGTVAQALRDLGYELRPSINPAEKFAYRFVRGGQVVDVITPGAPQDVVDVLVADHTSPSIKKRMLGYDMLPVEGGTQALRRTMNAVLTIESGRDSVLSVPNPFGALILKAAAHKSDSRNPERHLEDIVVLLACVDPFDERASSGSDRSRLLHIGRALSDPAASEWRILPEEDRQRAQDALAVLTE